MAVRMGKLAEAYGTVPWLGHAERARLRGPLVASAAALVVGASVGFLTVSRYWPVAPVAAGAIVLASLLIVAPRLGLAPTLAAFLVLGAVRRWFEWRFGSLGEVDPLLVVLPALTGAAVGASVLRPQVIPPSALSRGTAALSVLAVLGSLNPAQGNPAAGALGAVVFLTPVAWFLVGRRLLTDRGMARVLGTVVAVNVVAAVFALLQTASIHPPWDQAWIDSVQEQGYVTLFVGGGVVRPFGVASSAAEFGKVMGYGILVVASVVLVGRGRLRAAAAALGVLFGVVLALSALRTTTVLTAVAVAVVYGAKRRTSVYRLAAVGLIGLGALLVVSRAVPVGGVSSASVLLERQFGGLADPSESSLANHVEQVVDALRDTVTQPLGLGTAAINQAGKQFGEGQSADNDLGNAAIAWGVPGVLVFVWLVGAVVRQALAALSVRRDWLMLAATGIVLVGALQWLNGNLYSGAVVAWLCMGWLDRQATERP